MKKTYLLLFICTAIVSNTYAQWTTSGSDIHNTNGGNVGIGTNSPVEALSIANGSPNALGVYRNLDVTSVGPAGTFINLGARNGNIFTPGAQISGSLGNPATTGWLGFSTLTSGSLSTKMIIDALGNVGIGTSYPKRKLDLSNSGQLTFGDDVVTDSNNGLFWHSGSDYGIYRTAGSWTGGAYQQLRIQFDTGIQLGAGIGNTGFDKSYVEIINGKGLMVSSGNVGIGTTTPGAPLDVNGSFYLNRPSAMVDGGATLGASGYINLVPTNMSAGNAAYAVIGFPDNNTVGIYTDYDGHIKTSGTSFRDIQFGRKSAPYLTIKDGGNIGIGTSSPIGNLDVRGATFMGTTDLNIGATGSFVQIDQGTGTGNTYSRIRAFSNGGSAVNNLVLQSSGGNVGIGTITPGTALDVKGYIRSTTGGLQIGKFGIASNPSLSIGIDNWAFSNAAIINGWGNSSNPGISVGTTRNDGVAFSVVTGATLSADWLPSTSGTIAFTVLGNGNVGIGTTNTSTFNLGTANYKLAVGGNMIAEQVNVKMQADWPDYVFKNNYNLTPLSDLKTFIDRNHHLPEVPSEKEITEKGLNLGEMNKTLLKKVEELTLYLIEKDKEVKAEKEANTNQDRIIQMQNDKLNEITAQLEVLSKKVQTLTK